MGGGCLGHWCQTPVPSSGTGDVYKRQEHEYEFIGEQAQMSGDVSMIKQCARILIDNAAK